MATAIVTGTASGIGEALADKLVARGDTVYLADLDTDGAARVAERLGSRAFARRLDVTDAAAVQALVDEVDAEHGLDLMVNNAGIAVGGAADELGLEHWNRCIDVNLRGVVHGAHAAYLKMKARGRGQILNTASLAGLVVSPLTGPYTATKHAVVALSLSLRAEAALHGVQVSVLCPGVIDTPIFAQANDRLPQTAVGTKARELFHDLAKLLQGGKVLPAGAAGRRRIARAGDRRAGHRRPARRTGDVVAGPGCADPAARRDQPDRPERHEEEARGSEPPPAVSARQPGRGTGRW
ncbi:SDR family oxidoreductase [Thermocrispum agreste]|uniref:SDR family oxidoreductase n=1 Tax=Thermocrispum agreste TaxID=37925 RepID=UPI00041C4659|nr:SDR family oxidoreductase [Thermocrispum agreste]